MTSVPVIDADGHVLEPRAAWAHLDASIRPRIETDARGLDHVIVGDDDVFVAELGQMGTPGADVSTGSTEPYPLELARAGASAPGARLVDMDAEGIDVAVLYPTIGLGFWGITDAATAVSVARAYNDWLAAYCAAAPQRLHGAAMVPFQSPDDAVHELRRARDELGLVAAFVRPNPCLGRSVVDDAYAPFWDAAEELGMAVGVHEGFQLAVPPLGSDRTPRNVLVLHAVSHTFEQMFACAQLIAEGVLERHPDLRVVFLEAGGGWVPYWLARLDHQVSAYAGYAPRMRLTPSEYFGASVLGVVRDRRGDLARAGAVRRNRAHRVGFGLPPRRLDLPRRARRAPGNPGAAARRAAAAHPVDQRG